MIRKPVVLITGAGGEIGHGLIAHLAAEGNQPVVTLDVNPLEPALGKMVQREFTGSIMDKPLLERVLSEFEVETVYHLAALLSTRSEFTPVTAHQVNVEGTLNLLEFSQREAESHGRPVTFLYPVVDRRVWPARSRYKRRAGKSARKTTTTRRRRCTGATSCTASNWAATTRSSTSSWRPSRNRAASIFAACGFPGLISALTVPSGGTSDYAPEMIHAAAKGEPYACFVRPDTRIPFMAMPDGIDALLKLAAAPKAKADAHGLQPGGVQSVGAKRSATKWSAAFPNAEITWDNDVKRQGIVDSWPEDVDDSAARRDWGFAPAYDFTRAFRDYLIPTIRKAICEVRAPAVRAFPVAGCCCGVVEESLR